jgi:hypothetical protein
MLAKSYMGPHVAFLLLSNIFQDKLTKRGNVGEKNHLAICYTYVSDDSLAILIYFNCLTVCTYLMTVWLSRSLVTILADCVSNVSRYRYR